MIVFFFGLFVSQIFMVSKPSAWNVQYLVLKYPDEIYHKDKY